jgi:hypothetical protein
MVRVLALCIVLIALSATIGKAAETLVVASIRQYQFEGKSNIHLYLYGLDGSLKKKLTNLVGCDDVDPLFSYDGQSVYFTRKSTAPETAADAGLYKLDLTTNQTTREKENEAYMGIPVDELDYSFAIPVNSWNVAERNDCLSPDGLYRITLKPMPAPDANVNPPMQHLLSVQGKPAIDMATLPGFPAEMAKDYYSLEELNGTPFVTAKDYAAVFLVHHLDSTDGDQIWGLDLQSLHWTKMSQNGGEIYHPPGASGVFFACESLYEPLGNTGHTVNCCYLEWWDHHFKMTKLTPPLSVFYSAAIFHPVLGKPNGENETLEIGGATPP